MLRGSMHRWLRETEDCPPHLRVRRRVVQRSEQMLAVTVVVLVISSDHSLVEQCVQHRHTVLQTFVFPLEPRAVQRQKAASSAAVSS